MVDELVLSRIFSLANLLVLPGWLLLVFAPGWRWTQRVATLIVPLILGVTYAWLVLTVHRPTGGGFNSLTQLATLFTVRQALLAGWLHYLAFDLFTGAWEARDALRCGISRWAMAPCLILTFLFGPVGLALYLLLKLALRRNMEMV